MDLCRDEGQVCLVGHEEGVRGGGGFALVGKGDSCRGRFPCGERCKEGDLVGGGIHVLEQIQVQRGLRPTPVEVQF